MTKILATLGPNLKSNSQLKFFLKKSEILRLNLSHNDFEWHVKIVNKIKKIDRKKIILIDIPGIKPRTSNFENINIEKNQIVTFAYGNLKNLDVIKLSNPLPSIDKKIKFFTISDGQYVFKLKKFGKNFITGISNQNFILKPKKGLNIPNSKYDDKTQEKIYFKYLKMINNLSIECVGLSFIQNKKILIKAKKKYPKFFYVSKIENLFGFNNRLEIIKNSDMVMVDRGDLAAETGLKNLTTFTNKIISDCKKSSVPIIIATENLNSLIHDFQPTKSEVFNLDYFLEKKVDFIMLSDETATSTNWSNTLKWLNQYLAIKKVDKGYPKTVSLDEIIGRVNEINLIIFTKEGHFYKKVSTLDNIKHFYIFTENLDLVKRLKIKSNVDVYFTKFPKKNIDQFLFKNILKNKKVIFEIDSYALLVNVIFPRGESRANSLSIIEKKDFM